MGVIPDFWFDGSFFSPFPPLCVWRKSEYVCLAWVGYYSALCFTEMQWMSRVWAQWYLCKRTRLLHLVNFTQYASFRPDDIALWIFHSLLSLAKKHLWFLITQNQFMLFKKLCEPSHWDSLLMFKSIYIWSLPYCSILFTLGQQTDFWECCVF